MVPPCIEKRVGADQKNRDMPRREGGKRSFDLMIAAAIEDKKLLSDRACRFRYIPNLHLADRVIGVY